MNFKKIIAYAAGLTLSINVLALDLPLNSADLYRTETTQGMQIALNQGTYNAKPSSSQASNSTETVTEESEILAELTVYLLIIAAYSIYGLNANTKNIKD